MLRRKYHGSESSGSALSGPCLHAAYFHLKGSGGLGQACEGASAWELVFCYLGGGSGRKRGKAAGCH